MGDAIHVGITFWPKLCLRHRVDNLVSVAFWFSFLLMKAKEGNRNLSLNCSNDRFSCVLLAWIKRARNKSSMC
jgi:hypothetical protein